MEKLVKLAAVFGLSFLMLLGCGEPYVEDEDSLICECDRYQQWPTDCQQNPHRLRHETWTKEEHLTCDETQPAYCCAGSVRSAQYFNPNLLLDPMYSGFNAKATLYASTNLDIEDVIEPLGEVLENDFSCVSECSNPDSALCEVVEKFQGVDYGSAARSLDAKINSGVETIAKAEILELFEEETDPCERSDVSIQEDRVINTGLECYSDVKLDFSGIDVLKFTIEIPSRVEAIREVGDTNSNFRFESSDKALFLSIENEFLNKDYGGYIHQISKSESEIIVETDNGCIKI